MCGLVEFRGRGYRHSPLGHRWNGPVQLICSLPHCSKLTKAPFVWVRKQLLRPVQRHGLYDVFVCFPFSGGRSLGWLPRVRNRRPLFFCVCPSSENPPGVNELVRLNNAWLIFAHELGHNFGGAQTRAGEGQLLIRPKAKQKNPLPVSPHFPAKRVSDQHEANGRTLMFRFPGQNLREGGPCILIGLVD